MLTTIIANSLTIYTLLLLMSITFVKIVKLEPSLYNQSELTTQMPNEPKMQRSTPNFAIARRTLPRYISKHFTVI
jgi:hypothetical protein